MLLEVAGPGGDVVAQVTKGPYVLDFVLVFTVGRSYGLVVQGDREPVFLSDDAEPPGEAPPQCSARPLKLAFHVCEGDTSASIKVDLSARNRAGLVLSLTAVSDLLFNVLRVHDESVFLAIGNAFNADRLGYREERQLPDSLASHDGATETRRQWCVLPPLVSDV